MVITIRATDSPPLLEKIETIRSTKALYTYHSYLKDYTGKHCEICVLPLNPYGVYLKP